MTALWLLAGVVLGAGLAGGGLYLGYRFGFQVGKDGKVTIGSPKIRVVVPEE